MPQDKQLARQGHRHIHQQDSFLKTPWAQSHPETPPCPPEGPEPELTQQTANTSPWISLIHQWAGTRTRIPQAGPCPPAYTPTLGSTGPCNQGCQEPPIPISGLTLGLGPGLNHQWLGTSTRTTTVPQSAMWVPNPPTSKLGSAPRPWALDLSTSRLTPTLGNLGPLSQPPWDLASNTIVPTWALEHLGHSGRDPRTWLCLPACCH